MSSGPMVYIDTAHINNDTLMDLIFTGSTAAVGSYPIFWYRMDDLSSFTQFFIRNGADPDGIATTDIDNDGLTDVIIGDHRTTYTNGIGLGLFINTGGGFAPVNTILDEHTHLLRGMHSCGNPDNDLDIDLTEQCRAINLYWVENTGTGFTSHLIVATTFAQQNTPFFIDVDCDGNLDIMQIHGQYFKNTGGGSFSNQGNLFNNITVLGYDLNLDGAEDILRPDDTLAFTLNDGAGNFSPFTIIDSAGKSGGLDCGDLDCDYDIDIVYFRNDTIFIAFDTVSLPIPHTPAYEIMVLDTFDARMGANIAIANMNNDISNNTNINDIIVVDSIRAVWFKGECQATGINERGCKEFSLAVISNNKYAVFKYNATPGDYIYVLDILGRKLYEKELYNEKGTIYWGYNSPTGIYFCVLKAGNRKLASKFVIVK